MENIINIGTFIQHLTYYIKIAIYINKGTDKDIILEKCIKLYNKYKTIEAMAKITEEEETIVRRCLKRLNLILKIDDNGNPIDIRNKSNQLRMVYFYPHPSLANNNLESMISYANDNNINIMPDIPLTFILRDSKYKELLWQYTRSLFYISQLLLSKCDAEKMDLERKNIFDDAAEKLEEILILIMQIDEKIKVNEVMKLDKFLNNKLVKTGITDKNVNEAREEVKEIFIKKGLGEDNSMSKMIDSISDKLTSIDLSGGNIIQSMLGIAQNVAQEMSGDMQNNPEKFQSTIGAITEVFQDAMNESAENGNEMPDDIKNLFNTVLAAAPTGSDEISSEEIAKNLETIIAANGLDKNQFYQSIQGIDGEIDITKLEECLGKLQ